MVSTGRLCTTSKHNCIISSYLTHVETYGYGQVSVKKQCFFKRKTVFLLAMLLKKLLPDEEVSGVELVSKIFK